VRLQLVGHLVIVPGALHPPVMRVHPVGQVTLTRAQVTPREVVARAATLQPDGHLVVPRRARHPPLTRVQPEGHVTVARAHVTPAARAILPGTVDGHELVPRGAAQPPETRVQPMGHTIDRAHATPVVLVALAIRLQIPVAGQVVVPRGALHLPVEILLQPVGQENPQMTPRALAVRLQPTGHVAISRGDLQPPMTRVQPRGHVVVMREQVTPRVVVARATRLQPVGHVAVPRRARHPPVTRVQPEGQVVLEPRAQETPRALVRRFQPEGQPTVPAGERQPRATRAQPMGQEID